ncbi:MAG: restriction endonuclease subunit S, partial [Pseudomonadales bacterium]|nr:restriction endonuclease subunit S [Pseudomonadales bacterium]
MSFEWVSYKLSDLATFKYGKFLAKANLESKGFDVYSGYGVVGYLPDYQFERPQIIMVCRGEGGTGDVKMSPPKCSITNLSIIISENQELISKDFLYWALKASNTRKLRTGSAQAQIVIGTLENLIVSIPTCKYAQKEIASILSSLDNRISLLRETNTTLEAIAQTLFKSWFVDFDPVKVKAQGKQPEGMDEATAALFPSEFEESALGLIPKGWRVGTLGDVARLHKGSINPLHHQNTVFEHYSLPSFDNGQSPVMEAGIEIKSNKTSVPKNAVLLSKLNPHIPRVWLPSKIGDNAVCSTEFLVFVPADGASKEFIYCIFIA